MTSELAARMRLVDPSPTLAVTAKAKAMRAKGLDVIGFGAGEPDFDTPDHIKAAAKAAIDAGETKYTPNAGSPALKKAILAGIARDYGLEGCYAPDQVIVSAGAKQSLYNLMYALVGERDAVLIPVPAWVSYPAQVKMIGATPIEIPTDSAEGFRLDPEAVREAARSAKARGLHPKVLILNSPSNPTGAMYARADLERIAEIALEEGMWIVSDDMYMKIAYGETPFFSVATISPEVRARTIIVNGVSKAYAMTGWRIGYAVGDKAVLAATDDIQSQV
ncbi:MAG: aminotransferase class I/II-fold pyridoxal phosphate-dependent enzyme, partial [Myxococcales bacterium]|nr:aminotransferase class I/II-fold pyridoxal phosphate-dependent enzyme [Myxococcales bacterium]